MKSKGRFLSTFSYNQIAMQLILIWVFLLYIKNTLNTLNFPPVERQFVDSDGKK